MDRDKAYYDAYNLWLGNCMQIYHKHVEKVRKKRLAAAVFAIGLCSKKQKQQRKNNEQNVQAPIKFTSLTLPNKVLEDFSFHDYIQMSVKQFEKLVSLVGPDMMRQECIGLTIGVAEGLLLTLKFLASGDSVHSVSSQYSLEVESAEKIISGTCKAIWNRLVQSVMPADLTETSWLKIAKEFEEKWNFPHCIGAIDALNIMIQPPSDTDSSDEALKNDNIVLLVVCDANFVFTFVDMGNYGRKTHGEIFKESHIYNAFENNDMNLPDASPLPKYGDDTENFPYFLVGDEAFPLKTYLLRPYPSKDCIEISRLNFNCRLMRAQRTIETSIKILASRWRIFSKSIAMNVQDTITAVQACVCLHNWLRLSELRGNNGIQYVTPDLEDQKFRKVSEHTSAFKHINRIGSNLGPRRAVEIRDKFLEYFTIDDLK